MSDQEIKFLPEDVYNFFYGITQKPHPSANQEGVGDQNEDPVRAYVNDQAQSIDNVEVVFYEEDAKESGKRVIVLRRPGGGKFSDKNPVILQAHMDMVFNPVDMKFPLSMIQVPDTPDQEIWIKANEGKESGTGRDCTLGADDGIGVATALAILKDEDLKDYPMECIFTVQEETDMGGAQNCDITKLTGTCLLNLDAETLEQIIYGSAGGCETSYSGTVSLLDVPEGYIAIKLSISKLSGGHSGVDINKGRLNAIKVLTQALKRLNKRMTNFTGNGDAIGSYDFLLADMRRTDVIKANAIPAEAEAVIIVDDNDKEKLVADFSTYCESVKAQSTPEEKEMKYESKDESIPQQSLDEKSTDTILCILDQIPHGALKMIPEIPEIVEVSTNLYEISINNNNVSISSSNRSSNGLALDTLKKMQINTANFFGFTATTDINPYPSWPPNEGSPLLARAKDIYNQKYPDKASATVIHAGLECGVLVERSKNEKGCDLDAISIGPTIKDPHTPNESLQVQSNGIETVQSFYDVVKSIIKAIFAT